MKKFNCKALFLTCICAVFMVIGATDTFAYSTFGGGCDTCHNTGDEFKGPGKLLHDLHNTFVSSCTRCHNSVGDNPVTSLTADTPDRGCVGCHGRFEDAGNDSISEGLGAGLRQYHENKGESCGGCHSDNVPGGDYTPVGEAVFPPFYPEEGFLPCTDGLDNDGNLLADGKDPDCSVETYTISGIVSGDVSDGVTITLSGNADEATVTTGGGTYSFSGLTDGTYTVTPSLPGYFFNPENTPLSLSGAEIPNVDFTSVEVCVPTTTECSAVAECGVEVDECGNDILCGDCGSGFSCNETDNLCEEDPCVPTTTECSASAECGVEVDECGNDILCGDCGSGEHCVDNICIDTPDNDDDSDGVTNGNDKCLDTPFGEIVYPSNGCSIEQLVPCDGDWKNHGKYVSALAKTTNRFVEQGLLTEDEKDVLMGEMVSSDCGK